MRVLAIASLLLSVGVEGFLIPFNQPVSTVAPSKPVVKLTVVQAGKDDDFLKNVARSARKASATDRVVELNKPLGLVLEEDDKGNVYVADLQAGGNAAQSGKIKKGDVLTMISATFGEELWSTRNVGLSRVLSAIRIRAGSSVTLVLESAKEGAAKKASISSAAAAKAAKAAQAEEEKTNKLLKQLEADDANTKKGKKFFGLF